MPSSVNFWVGLDVHKDSVTAAVFVAAMTAQRSEPPTGPHFSSIEGRGRGSALPVDGSGRCPIGHQSRRVPVSVLWAPLGGSRHGGACTGFRGSAMAGSGQS